MAETAGHLVDHVIPRVPGRQWVLSFPIPLRLLFATHPELLAPVLQIVHRVIATFLIQQAGLQRTEAHTGAVTLIQRFASAVNLNIYLHCLVLDVCRTNEGVPLFHTVHAPPSQSCRHYSTDHKTHHEVLDAQGLPHRRAGHELSRRYRSGYSARATAGGGLHLPHRARASG
jgi:hypothetical protein